MRAIFNSHREVILLKLHYHFSYFGIDVNYFFTLTFYWYFNINSMLTILIIMDIYDKKCSATFLLLINMTLEFQYYQIRLCAYMRA